MTPCWRNTMSRRQFLLVLLLLTAIVGSGAALWHLALRRATEALSVVRPKETTVDLDAVVTRIHDLNRLETASMHVIHVSTLSQSYQLVPDTFGGDSITFFAAGDVIAGVDLSQLKPSDVSRPAEGRTVRR